jgi:oxygen-independent coproporphyrinogen-3 oxidase
VLGLGVGAFSTDPPGPGAPFGIRRANLRRLDAYLERIAAGASAESGAPEVLDAHTARGEAAFLALRCAEGLDAAGFRREFGATPRGFWDREIQELVAGELLCEASDGSLRLTRRGRLVSDGVFEYFV